MFEALSARGWKFKFKVEATSPHGYPYSAEGETPIVAFLKAFGQWRKDLPKVPPRPAPAQEAPLKKPEAYVSGLVHELLGDASVVEPFSAPELRRDIPKPVRKWRDRHADLLNAWTETRRPYLRHLAPPSKDPRRNQVRLYNRLYQRVYRKEKLLEVAA